MLVLQVMCEEVMSRKGLITVVAGCPPYVFFVDVAVGESILLVIRFKVSFAVPLPRKTLFAEHAFLWKHFAPLGRLELVLG